MKEKTPDEVLEEQRSEATETYALKVRALTDKYADLQSKCNDMEATVNEAVAQKLKEIETMQTTLKEDIQQANDKYTLAQEMLKEATLKLDAANKKQEDVEALAKEHTYNIDAQLNEMANQKDDLQIRHAVCADREKSAYDKNIEADANISDAVKREEDIQKSLREIESKISELDSMISQNSELVSTNTIVLGKINEVTAENAAKDQELRLRENDASSALLGAQEERKRLSIRKTELDEKEATLKQGGIKYALDMQRLIDKQKEIDTNIGKFNELKNNVESLMKIQDNKGV